MPQGYAELWTSLPAPLDRARQYLERRGESLPETALRALAREVILRVPRAAQDAETAFATPETVHQADRAEIEALCDALLSPDDAAAAAQAVARLADAPALNAALRSNALTRSHLFAWPTIAEQLCRLYAEEVGA